MICEIENNTNINLNIFENHLCQKEIHYLAGSFEKTGPVKISIDLDRSSVNIKVLIYENIWKKYQVDADTSSIDALLIMLYENVIKYLLHRVEKDLESFSKSSTSEVEAVAYTHYAHQLKMWTGEGTFFEYFGSLLQKRTNKNPRYEIMFFDNFLNMSQAFSCQFDSLEERKKALLFYVAYFHEAKKQKKKKHSHNIYKLSKRLFDDISHPVLLFNQFDDLTLHNQSFLSLGILPKKCLKFSEQGQITILEQHYDIGWEYFVHEDMRYKLLQLIPIKNMDLALKNEELGVITSSLAHELNNPIGGIMASLDVLKLVAHFEESNLVVLEEMKKSVLRCRDLIQTFLGFSKKNIDKDFDPDIGQSLRGATSLLNTRLVENNLNFDFETCAEDRFSITNKSVWTMIFYMLLTELLNRHLRTSLIEEKGHALFSAKISFFKERVEIGPKGKKNLLWDKAKIKASVLLRHLLRIEKVHLSFSEGGEQCFLQKV